MMQLRGSGEIGVARDVSNLILNEFCISRTILSLLFSWKAERLKVTLSSFVDVLGIRQEKKLDLNPTNCGGAVHP
jgi:hypothetical protein